MIEQATVLLNCNNIIKSTLYQIFREPQKMDDFLSLISRIPYMEIENLLLLYPQKPDAFHLAGYGAWEHLGRNVLSNQVPIILKKLQIEQAQSPKIKKVDNQIVYDQYGNTEYEDYGKYNVRYQPVYVFDITQTTGAPINLDMSYSHDINIYKIFNTITGYITKIDDNEILKPLEKSKYISSENTLYIKEGISDFERENEYLVQLIYYYLNQKLADKTECTRLFITECVVKIIRHHYGYILENEPLYLNCTLEDDNYSYILHLIQHYALSIIEIIDGGAYLTFNEIACLNYLYDKYPASITDNYFFCKCMAAEQCANEEECQEILSKLSFKIRESNIKVQRELYKLRTEKQLYSFPPIKLYK